MTMTVHNYRPRQFHRTSNGEHPSSGYRYMGSASLAAARPDHDDNTPPARNFVVTESVFGFTKLILHHPRAVTAASRGSTIADLALRITHQPEPYILWSRFTHAQPCLTLISTVWALVCATAPPVRSPAKASAILNESVTAVTASRFSPVIYPHCGILAHQ